MSLLFLLLEMFFLGTLTTARVLSKNFNLIGVIRVLIAFLILTSFVLRCCDHELLLIRDVLFILVPS